MQAPRLTGDAVKGHDWLRNAACAVTRCDHGVNSGRLGLQVQTQTISSRCCGHMVSCHVGGRRSLLKPEQVMCRLQYVDTSARWCRTGSELKSTAKLTLPRHCSLKDSQCMISKVGLQRFCKSPQYCKQNRVYWQCLGLSGSSQRQNFTVGYFSALTLGDGRHGELLGCTASLPGLSLLAQLHLSWGTQVATAAILSVVTPLRLPYPCTRAAAASYMQH
mmetsp:Transcript_43589/g.97766  ORF Transcript_43589/g.97766 Transcript_43589/m.97766 type:complete len:219 (-) Transcript_43589:59-715(-)